MIRVVSVRRAALTLFGAGVLFAVAPSCASAPRQPIGVTSLPGVIEVREWPYQIDIPIQETSNERIWRTVIDVVAERAAIAVMDREGGYMRTEWKQSPITYGGKVSEERYTLRMQPQEGKIRLGLEVRIAGTSTYPTTIINTVQAPWTAIYRELQQRLVKM